MDLRELTIEEKQEMMDLSNPQAVGVQIGRSPSGHLTLWVCVDGVCKLRVTRCSEIEYTCLTSSHEVIK